MMARPLYRARPAHVRWGGEEPVEVDGEAISSLRESWLVEDRWWTAEPLRRRYWELVGEHGRNIVVFHDLGSDACGGGRGGGWFVQGP
jgi:hypothetical protein